MGEKIQGISPEEVDTLLFGANPRRQRRQPALCTSHMLGFEVNERGELISYIADPVKIGTNPLEEAPEPDRSNSMSKAEIETLFQGRYKE